MRQRTGFRRDTGHRYLWWPVEVGAERIIHSEDFPYVFRDNVSEFLAQVDLTDNERHAIAHRNAETLVRI